MVALNREMAGSDGTPTKRLYVIADRLTELAAYVVSIAGITTGNRIHIQMKPHLPGFDQLYAGTVLSVSSDGGAGGGVLPRFPRMGTHDE